MSNSISDIRVEASSKTLTLCNQKLEEVSEELGIQLPQRQTSLRATYDAYIEVLMSQGRSSEMRVLERILAIFGENSDEYKEMDIEEALDKLLKLTSRAKARCFEDISPNEFKRAITQACKTILKDAGGAQQRWHARDVVRTALRGLGQSVLERKLLVVDSIFYRCDEWLNEMVEGGDQPGLSWRMYGTNRGVNWDTLILIIG